LVCNIGNGDPLFSIIDDAILYSGAMGAKIINLSVYPSTIFANNQNTIDAINYVTEMYGTIVVYASGNNGYPSLSEVENVLFVGATNSNDQRWQNSTYGEGLFISAPGVNMYSTKNNDTYENILAHGVTFMDENGNPTYINLPADGTSYSAPIVSGVIALMLSVNPCLTPEQVKDILKQTADKVGGYNYEWNPENLGHSKELGYGRINAYEAVLMAQQTGSAYDLMVKDSPEDTGAEPNTITEHTWKSKDIWVRHTNDNGTLHQNPEYDPVLPNYVYVKVTNRGCVASSGNDTLKVYWSKAATAMSWDGHWNGSTFPTGQKRGAMIGEISIPVIQPGEEDIVIVEWNDIPNPETYMGINTEPWHFCLLARIESDDDPMTFTETTSTGSNVRKNNNIAQKNITIVNANPNFGLPKLGGVIAVGNPFDITGNFTLNFLADNKETGKKIFEEAEVSITLDENLLAVWENGGKQGNNIIQRDERTVMITGDNASLDNLIFEADEFATLYLKFNFLTQEVTEKELFTFHVIQKESSNNEVIGGETYEIYKNPRALFFADGGDDKYVDKNEIVTLIAESINEPALYNWYDSEGNLIYEGADFNVSVDIGKKYKLEVITLSDGYKDYTEVEVNLNPNVIVNAYPNPASDSVSVQYKINLGDSAYLAVTGVYGANISNNYVVDINENTININIIDYPLGIYSVALIVNGQIQDTKTIIKQ
jgi:hypothetical protein